MVGGGTWRTTLVWWEDETMSTYHVLKREIKFTARDRSVWLWLVIVLSLSAISVGFGLVDVERQNTTIEKLMAADQQDRLLEFEKVNDWGGAAYYSFHLTYDAPSNFAYAAMGLRDVIPWKHRIRMLALEGQIYERDVGNPSIALIGRFDFAFFTAFIIPLVLIMLLYDLKTSEKTAGRHDLLEATIGRPFAFWLLRACLRASGLFLCLMTPLIIAGLIAGTSLYTLILASLFVFCYTFFWTALCFVISFWRKPSSVILMTLITIWIATAVILPAGARFAIDRLVPVPPGADILMLQRETVNDAWDLPKKVTMDGLFSNHPEWSDYEPVTSSFDWPWYYAFQQVGDEKTESLSTAYRSGRLRRAHIAAWVSLLAPPSLLERSLQSLANTDLDASLIYEDKVRAYHAALRGFYYPRFFRNEAFDKSLLENLPTFESIQ